MSQDTPGCHRLGGRLERNQRRGRTGVEHAAAQRRAVEREAKVEGAARAHTAALALLEQLNVQLRSVCAQHAGRRVSSARQTRARGGVGEGRPRLVEAAWLGLGLGRGARVGAQGGHAEGASSSKAASSPKRVESWPLHTCSRCATAPCSHAPAAASLAALTRAAAIAPIASRATRRSAMRAVQRYAPAALAALTSASVSEGGSRP